MFSLQKNNEYGLSVVIALQQWRLGAELRPAGVSEWKGNTVPVNTHRTKWEGQGSSPVLSFNSWVSLDKSLKLGFLV